MLLIILKNDDLPGDYLLGTRVNDGFPLRDPDVGALEFAIQWTHLRVT
jgi:hypothetical protein